MSKWGILIRAGKAEDGGKNIGDFYQSIAQRQFLKGKDTRYVEIEEMSDFMSLEPVNVIMNGWFTWDCKKFLPPACINPLMVSFHLTPPKEDEFFSPENTAYMKAHEPIGARDIKTMEIMQKHGIDSYFSGCLTMTLGKDYKIENCKHDGEIIIVDPYLELGGDDSAPRWLAYLRALWHAVRYFVPAIKLMKRHARVGLGHGLERTIFRKMSARLDKLVILADYYALYSQRFDDEILMNAKYISAVIWAGHSTDEKFAMADETLKMYANAKCVITSRLHTSFPCLAVGTKNIFVIPSEKTEDKSVVRYSGRLGGLEDTVNVMEIRDGKLLDKTGCYPKKISLSNFPNNMDGYKKYEKSLIKIVEEFVEECEHGGVENKRRFAAIFCKCYNLAA